jgi:glycosyltransferase involved in cell wall biosynthesis
MMLYHTHPVKGSADGFEALSLLRKELPDLQATLFGTSRPSPPLPRWVDYRRLPSQPELRACYNRAAIFIAPAHIEGWPLPPAEAMICGAALAATDIGGHREFGIDGETALLSPAGSPEKLAENVLRLVRNAELRTKIARRGYEHIRRCSWNEALDSFERMLNHSPARKFEVSPALQAAVDRSQAGD